MNSEEVQALVAEKEALRAEVGALRQQLADVTRQLRAVLERIAELEQRKPEPPAFVRPNRSRTEPAGLRKKRASEHNTS